MTRFSRTLLVVIPAAVIVILVLASVVVSHMDRVQVNVTVKQVENDIRDHLPDGSSRAQVAAYLDKAGIPHSYVAETKYGKYSNCEMAIIRDSAHNWLIKSDIQIYFMFDKDLKLVRNEVMEINTGP